jgi:hypothetical protein
MPKNPFVEISKTLLIVDKHMTENGFETNLAIENDNFKITGKEVTIKMPYTLKLTIPISEFEGSEDDISRKSSYKSSRKSQQVG